MNGFRIFRGLFRKGKLDRDMAEEMHAHLKEQTQRNVAAGMSLDDALAAAHRQFGGVTQLQEIAREQRGWLWLERFVHDVRFSLRMLTKNPGFSAAAILTLALGVGFVTILFTIVNGIAFRGLPFAEPRQIVSVGLPSQHLATYTSQQTSFSSVALVRAGLFNLSGDAVVASRQAGAAISPTLFDLLRVRPVTGRGFAAEDGTSGAEKVAIIGDALWQQNFHADPATIGRQIRINGETHTIIGIMPPGFGFPRSENIWVPLPTQSPVSGALVVGRLHAHTSLRSAAEEATVIAARLVATLPEADGGSAGAIEIVPFAERSIKGAVRNLLTGILGATFLVLLLACANVANLVLARACERGRELALRSALGASRARLIAQMVTESLVLSVIGATLGALAAQWSTRLIWNYTSGEKDLTGGVPFWVNFEPDGTVLLFVIGTAVLASLLTGLIPALRASRFEVGQQIKDGGSGSLRLSRLMRTLVNVQMALSVCLVVAAGLFLTLLIDFNRKELPYDPRTVLTARASLNEKDHPTPAQRTVLIDDMLVRLAASPGVEAVAATSAESFRATPRQIEIEGHTYARRSALPGALFEAVTAGYFAALNQQLRDGRVLQATDRADAPPVAVVNAAFAARFGVGAASVVGRRFRIASPNNGNPWVEIVGVVADAGSMKAAKKTDGPIVYRPLAQDPAVAVTLVVRGAGDGTGLVDQLRSVVAARDPDLPLHQVHTIQHILEMERIGINLPGMLLVLCGLGALALASVGVYGVVAFSVRTRTREFGVRLALGATPAAILRLVVGSGLRQLAFGLGAGVLLAFGASAMLSAMFVGFGRTAYDAWIYLAVVTLLTGVGAAALFLPARRASRVDPMIALRTE